MSDPQVDVRKDPERRKNKREIVIVWAIALSLLAFGAVWTLINGEQRNKGLVGPAIVHEEGPATMPGPAAMPRSGPADAPRSAPQPVQP